MSAAPSPDCPHRLRRRYLAINEQIYGTAMSRGDTETAGVAADASFRVSEGMRDAEFCDCPACREEGGHP